MDKFRTCWNWIGRVALVLGVGCTVAASSAARATFAAENLTSAERGYRNLTQKVYVPSAFTERDFADVWRAWPEPLRTQAERATPAERRQMAFRRYGLTPRPGDDSGQPLQYAVASDGSWSMSCFGCHGGQVDGRVIPGLPNANFLMETLTDEIRESKQLLERPLSRGDFGNIALPFGGNVGTTNAVMFGVLLMAFRDPDLNVLSKRLPPPMVHHDMEAPPWWHYHRKKQIYIDGFAEKGHRGLMQFALDPRNGPEKFREWEPDFRDVKAFIESLRPPKYPRAFDTALAARGERAFGRVCAECHGTYGAESRYPERMVPIDELGTDRVRYDALTSAHRKAYGDSWFAEYGQQNTVAKPDGYVAPPLDGIWASGPYFHNGAVPTLWHVLHPGERPMIWRRTDGPYDFERIGPSMEPVDAIPEAVTKAERRMYFDTRALGKSAAGHTYPDALSADEKRAVLEYLKSL